MDMFLNRVLITTDEHSNINIPVLVKLIPSRLQVLHVSLCICLACSLSGTNLDRHRNSLGFVEQTY